MAALAYLTCIILPDYGEFDYCDIFGGSNDSTNGAHPVHTYIQYGQYNVHV